MGLVSLIKRKAAFKFPISDLRSQFSNLIIEFTKLRSEILAEPERQSESDTRKRELPEDARYQIGDIINLAGCGIPLDDLEILDVKAGGYANVYMVAMKPSGRRYALKTFQDWCLDS